MFVVLVCSEIIFANFQVHERENVKEWIDRRVWSEWVFESLNDKGFATS
jgi:hypothetical protein